MNVYSAMSRENTALLAIDPINFCADEKCELPEYGVHFTKIRQMLPKLNDFIEKYRKEVGGKIIFTTTTPWDKDHLTKNINELYEDPSCVYYSPDKTGFDQQFYGMNVKDADLVVTKNTYDVFAEGSLADDLKAQGIQYIVIAGVFTDGCVLASVVGGFSKGFNFVILKDLIETTDLPVRQDLQKILIEYTFPKMYGRTITSKELLMNFGINQQATIRL